MDCIISKHLRCSTKNKTKLNVTMSSGQEGLMAVREERVREGGIETTNTTFVSSTDEGFVCALTFSAAHFYFAIITPSNMFLRI